MQKGELQSNIAANTIAGTSRTGQDRNWWNTIGRKKIQYNRKECWVEAAPATTSGTQSARQEGPDALDICRMFYTSVEVSISS